MEFFQTENGIIITFDQRDAFIQAGKRIEVVPAWEWL
jgi:predicted AAA+ superfamily ATPase